MLRVLEAQQYARKVPEINGGELPVKVGLLEARAPGEKSKRLRGYI